MGAALEALLVRHRSLGIHPLRWRVHVHPERDPGCLRRGHEFLRAQSTGFAHALAVLDRQGCGSADAAEALECQLESRLRGSGWGDRAKAVVIDPELEAWVWSNSPRVDAELGWAGRLPGLRDWLAAEQNWALGAAKPPDPKAAMEAALRIARKPRSSAIYAALASKVSFERCQDRAFRRLCNILVEWFGVGPDASSAARASEGER